MMRSRPGPSSSGAARRGCSDAEILAITGARAAGPRSEAGFLARWPRLGAPVPVLPHKASSTGGPAGCGARSSSSARRWRPACRRRLPADRHQRAAGQARLPGPRPRRLDRPQWPACPVRPRRRARRVVLRLPRRPRPTWAAASCGPGASCPPPSASVTWAPTCWKPGRRPRPARGQGVQRQGVRRVPGRLRHRRAGPAHQGPAQDHAGDPAEGHRPVAQPHRDHL